MGNKPRKSMMPLQTPRKIVADQIRLADHQQEPTLLAHADEILRALEQGGYQILPKRALEIYRETHEAAFLTTILSLAQDPGAREKVGDK